jgi:hypothetical protein
MNQKWLSTNTYPNPELKGSVTKELKGSVTNKKHS